jgi:predicted nucleic acid-binding protein
MRDKAILDTGVILAIYFEEDGSERAVETASEHSPITVDLAVAEVGNAAWKRVALFGESKDRYRGSLQMSRSHQILLYIRLVRTSRAGIRDLCGE